MRKSAKKRKPQPSPPDLALVAVAALAGCVLASIGGWWIAAGRIDYWTGPTERHHFVATPDSSPAVYWTLVLVFCSGAVMLWVKIITDAVRRIRSRPAGRTHAS